MKPRASHLLFTQTAGREEGEKGEGGGTTEKRFSAVRRGENKKGKKDTQARNCNDVSREGGKRRERASAVPAATLEEGIMASTPGSLFLSYRKRKRGDQATSRTYKCQKFAKEKKKTRREIELSVLRMGAKAKGKKKHGRSHLTLSLQWKTGWISVTRGIFA